ncbi:hypothetical protein HPB49_009365 [Dermacentor silvarum]|uniref:Uncharacterized protein n=1 Tax=Dermacentor silvarum TaxID=543639 RepID=A0ACB8CQY4_DERSI|nr:hypothetical protein HPB49_009365 [Dermacentor silvarum]
MAAYKLSATYHGRIQPRARPESPLPPHRDVAGVVAPIPDCRTVLSGSKPAIVNFATNNVHGTTARVCSRIARPETNVTVKWFPAHAGELDAGPNRNEEADTEAHALTSRGRNDPMPKTKSIPSQPTATFCSGTERADASTHRLTETYNAAKQPHYGSCKYKPYGPPSGQSTFARRHLLWDCAPPPGNQEEAMPTAISSKIISREPGNQRDVVQHVLSILERQRPKAAPPRV